ncbi:FAD-binding domain-containing protein [Poritiphilus flavus]|uniref:Deoxyribodipyrimidine photolyase n=1 Tax=Poritiphilus flavus TaxID=2697053 RepID=A0A6L9ECK5_9FLAO|nr:FAD-binding domain-containing protein [Poritiphilus flavus]NAS12129.1 deoxyribodipyrimidine photolyase [Poritiphilus flavus]
MSEQLFQDIELFPTDLSSIHQRIRSIDPLKYGRTRNFIDGAVTHLSPYISRGVISTRQVLEHVLDRGYSPDKIEKFIQELAWRDYWQQIWIAKGIQINDDLRSQQQNVENFGIPSAVILAKTGIEAIDKAIAEFYETGYLHNHLRMYFAAICCNVGRSHWRIPAKWMYYHLLDADWASNALSWQWVAGTNSRRKYVANQENINKYCYTDQKDTFLNIPYADFEELPVPEVLKRTEIPEMRTNLPETPVPELDPDLPLCVYNFYNLDPEWGTGTAANRVLLLEPKHFQQYPISDKTLDFTLSLAENIRDIQVFTGSFTQLKELYGSEDIHFKEHPLNLHYSGTEHTRDWMFSVQGHFQSFFAYWKKCRKELKYPK